MKKRTKVFLAIVGVAVAAALVASGLSLFGVVAYMAEQLAFTVAVGSVLVGTGVGVFAGASSTVGYFRRRHAEKVQGNNIARMLDNSYGNVLSNENVFALSNDLTKSMVYSAENNQSGLIGRREVPNQNVDATIQENKSIAYGARSRFANTTPRISVRQSKIYSKKQLQARTALKKLTGEQSKIDGVYTYVAEIRDPYNNNIYYDYRNEISCIKETTKNAFKKAVLGDRERASDTYKLDFGYAVNLNFSTNSIFKNTFAKSNVETSMEQYELMLLKEVAAEIDYKIKHKEITATELDKIFPIQLNRVHYTSHKKSKTATIIINDREELKTRIKAIQDYLATEGTRKKYLERINKYSLENEQTK